MSRTKELALFLTLPLARPSQNTIGTAKGGTVGPPIKVFDSRLNEVPDPVPEGCAVKLQRVLANR